MSTTHYPVSGGRVFTGANITTFAATMDTQIKAGGIPVGDPWDETGFNQFIVVPGSGQRKGKKFVGGTAITASKSGVGGIQDVLATTLLNKVGTVLTSGITSTGNVLLVIGFYKL